MKNQFSMTYWKKIYDSIYAAHAVRDFAKVNDLKIKLGDYFVSCGMEMPPEKYPYDKDDRGTWKFIPTDSSKKENWTMLNPDWVYKGRAILNGDY